MKTTIDIPEPLYKRAKIRAIERGQSLKQIVLTSLERELAAPVSTEAPPVLYWANRKLLPEFKKKWKPGVFSGGTDSTRIISEDRNER